MLKIKFLSSLRILDIHSDLHNQSSFSRLVQHLIHQKRPLHRVVSGSWTNEHSKRIFLSNDRKTHDDRLLKEDWQSSSIENYSLIMFSRRISAQRKNIFKGKNVKIKEKSNRSFDLHEHRYFSSIFPRQSKANAIFIAKRRIVPVRFLIEEKKIFLFHENFFSMFFLHVVNVQ